MLTRYSWGPGQLTSVRRAAETSSPGHPGHSRDRTPAAQTEASGWGGAGSRRTPTWGEGARQAPGPLSCRAWEGHGTQAQQSLRLCAAPENLNPSGVGLGSAGNPGLHQTVPLRSNLEPERRRPGKCTQPRPRQTVPLQSNLEPERRRPGKCRQPRPASDSSPAEQPGA